VTRKRIPTDADVAAVAGKIFDHPCVKSVAVRAVLSVTTDLLDSSSREEIYKIEKQIMDANPDLLFDFRTTIPRADP
jgi:hypothetical protein